MSNAAVKRSNSGEIIRGGLLSFVFATILVLVFSLIVKLTNMSATAVPIVNQVIKILSVFLGVFFSLKNKEKCWLKGILSALLFAVLSFVVFSLLANSFNWAGFGIDLAIDAVVGAIAGIICGLRKKSFKQLKNSAFRSIISCGKSIGGKKYETHQHSCGSQIQHRKARHRLRRMPFKLPIGLQDELHGGQSKLRAESCRFGKRRRQII